MKEKMIKLDDCLELITYGFTNPMVDSDAGPWKVTAKDVVDGRINFNTARHTTQEAYDNELTDKSRPVCGDILLTKDGTLGRLAIVRDEVVCINQSVALLRVNKEIVSPEYIFYILSSDEYQAKMIADAGGSTIKHIYITRVNQLFIPYMTFDKQKKFVGFIKPYDEMIDNCKLQIELLQEMAKRMYKEWFIDLKFPGYEQVEVIDSVPRGWISSSIGDLLEIRSGYAFKSSWWQKEGVPVVKIKDIFDDFVNTDELDCVDADKIDKCKDFKLEKGDLVVAMTGATIGKIGVVPDIDELYTNQRVGKFFPKYKGIQPFLYCFYLQKSTVESILAISSSSSAQPNISGNQLTSFGLVYDLDTIKNFSNYLRPNYEKIICLKNQIKKLTEQRKIVLSKLMSGEIEV